MLGLRQRIAFTAALLIGVVPSGSKAQECYDAIAQDYNMCKQAEYYSCYGCCENRRAEQMAHCAQTGEYLPPGASQKDQCLARVQAEYEACGSRGVLARTGGSRGSMNVTRRRPWTYQQTEPVRDPV
jgi:hypothetical protein